MPFMVKESARLRVLTDLVAGEVLRLSNHKRHWTASTLVAYFDARDIEIELADMEKICEELFQRDIAREVK